MSTAYCCYFIKDNKYRGGFAIQSHTTKSSIIDVIGDFPYVFKGEFYDTYEGDYQAIEIDLNCFERLKKSFCFINYDYFGFLQELLESMEIAIKNNFKLFLGSE